jgi:hypothetical protein
VLPAFLPLIFGGRSFSTAELDLIREVPSGFTALGITEISRRVFELLEWKRPNGGLKNPECRQLLERLAGQGLPGWPGRLGAGAPGRRQIRRTAHRDPRPEICGSAGESEPLRLEVVRGGRADRTGEHALFKELLDRYHYLGYRLPVGASLRYGVRSERMPEQVLAWVRWSSPAGRMAVRDSWIGWSDEQPARNLQFIGNGSAGRTGAGGSAGGGALQGLQPGARRAAILLRGPSPPP